MRKELAALAILAILFTGSVINIRYMDDLSESLITEVEYARSLAGAGDYDRSEAIIKDAINCWNVHDGYTHIFIRHPEIDSATDAFYELYDSVSEHDVSRAQGAFEKVEAHLSSIASMEHITVGSIL